MAWKSKRVLVFNPRKILIAIFHSGFAAARSYGIHTQSVHYACTGRSVSASKNYFRYEDENVEIDEKEDLGTLKLDEYDKLCGVEYKTYHNSLMTRKGSKYNTKKRKERAARIAAKQKEREEERARYKEELRQEILNELKSSKQI